MVDKFSPAITWKCKIRYVVFSRFLIELCFLLEGEMAQYVVEKAVIPFSV